MTSLPGALGRRLRTLRDEPSARVVARSRLKAPYYRRRFAEFGDGAVLDRPLWVYGAHHIAFGPGVFILRGAWLSAELPSWGSPEPALRLGTGVMARPYVTLSAAESVVIEDNVILSSFVTVIDNEHTWRAGVPRPIDNPLDTKPVRIGTGTLVGERTSVLSGADIGRFCLIGANSVVKGTIPDFSIAVGAPARVVGTTQGKGADLAARALGS